MRDNQQKIKKFSNYSIRSNKNVDYLVNYFSYYGSKWTYDNCKIKEQWAKVYVLYIVSDHIL